MGNTDRKNNQHGSDSLKPENVSAFNDFIFKLKSNSNENNFWKSIPEIAEITGSTDAKVYQYIDSFSDFVRNKHGKYTIRELYSKYTPTFQQFLHAWVGTI